MTLQLFAHPFSSYCWKVLIALWENDTPFDYRPLDQDHLDNGAEWATLWPLRKMPVLVDDGRVVVETSVIIEHLDLFHPGPVRFVPADATAAIETRMLDRIFDNYVMTPMTKHVADAMRAEDAKDPAGVADAGAMLDTSYAWLDQRLAGRKWAAGDAFSLADCAGAPALFYTDWVRPIPESYATLRAYRARVLARPSVARAVEEARPYRALFPLGAPDRD
jgi:glutathione S-transferase